MSENLAIILKTISNNVYEIIFEFENEDQVILTYEFENQVEAENFARAAALFITDNGFEAFIENQVEGVKD